MARPLIFIGSSQEGLPVAKAIQAELQYAAECVIWSQGVFGLSEGTLESLSKSLETFDFGILVLTPDDLVASRGNSQPAPRDNVLLELGMFIGGLGRQRTFLVVDRSAKLKLPSDLAGITPAPFEPPSAGTMQAAVGPACTSIEDIIKRMGPRGGWFSVGIKGSYFKGNFDDEGIVLTVTNTGKETIPPYDVTLFHPNWGSWRAFPSRKKGELLPHQKRDYSFTVRATGDIEPFVHSFETVTEGKPLDPQLFTLRLVLEDSEKVLYQHRRMADSPIRLYPFCTRQFGTLRRSFNT